MMFAGREGLPANDYIQRHTAAVDTIVCDVLVLYCDASTMTVPHCTVQQPLGCTSRNADQRQAGLHQSQLVCKAFTHTALVSADTAHTAHGKLLGYRYTACQLLHLQ